MNDVGARTSRSAAEASSVGARPGPAGGRSASADADEQDRDALEEERSFLLRSLDDLDAERADGNVDDETYARLHADYTARAARVLHQLDGDAGATVADAPPVSTRRRVLTVAGIVAFAVIAGIALAYGLGARLPGETITGNSAANRPVSAKAAAAARVRALRAEVRAEPTDVAARLALAQAYLGSQNGRAALAQYQEAAKLDPTNPEPFAYSGWLIRLQGFPDQGLTLIDKAISIRPDYPDARFFKGVILFRDKSQPDAAIAEFQRYLVAAPDSPLAPQVRQLLAQAVEAGTSGSSTSTTAPPTTTRP
jgi:cytochrome c-type biogenesis protein CcmH/NrfG